MADHRNVLKQATIPNRWEHFPHGADIGVRGVGSTIDAAFEQAALALTAVTIDLEKLAAVEWFDVQCEAPDRETLLVDWLNELVYESARRRMLFCRFHVRIDDGRLTARVGGQPIHVENHDAAVEVKGATFTCLHVGESDGQWVAQCVVDV